MKAAEILKKLLKSLHEVVLRNKGYFVTFIIVAVLFVLFTKEMKMLAVLAVFGSAATFLTTYKRYFQAPPVLELITLTTVIVSLQYGPWIAALYTVIISITSEVAGQAFDMFSLTYIPPRIIMGFVAYYVFTVGMITSFALLGLLMSLFYNLLQQPVYIALTDVEKRLKGLYFSSINIPLNFMIFKFLGTPLMTLLEVIY